MAPQKMNKMQKTYGTKRKSTSTHVNLHNSHKQGHNQQNNQLDLKVALMAHDNWAPTRENMSLWFPTKRDSNQSSQLQKLARKWKVCL